MVLIDPRELERINEAVTQKSREAPTGKLENDMKRTLDRTDLSIDDMMRLYHQLLQRYLQKNEHRRKEPLNITVKKVKEENPAENAEEEEPPAAEAVEGGDNLEREIAKKMQPIVEALMRQKTPKTGAKRRRLKEKGGSPEKTAKRHSPIKKSKRGVKTRRSAFPFDANVWELYE